MAWGALWARPLEEAAGTVIWELGAPAKGRQIGKEGSANSNDCATCAVIQHGLPGEVQAVVVHKPLLFRSPPEGPALVGSLLLHSPQLRGLPTLAVGHLHLHLSFHVLQAGIANAQRWDGWGVSGNAGSGSSGGSGGGER